MSSKPWGRDHAWKKRSSSSPKREKKAPRVQFPGRKRALIRRRKKNDAGSTIFETLAKSPGKKGSLATKEGQKKPDASGGVAHRGGSCPHKELGGEKKKQKKTTSTPWEGEKADLEGKEKNQETALGSREGGEFVRTFLKGGEDKQKGKRKKTTNHARGRIGASSPQREQSRLQEK